MSEQAKIILELLYSLNKGNTGYAQDRVSMAVSQYNQLVLENIIEGKRVEIK